MVADWMVRWAANPKCDDAAHLEPPRGAGAAGREPEVSRVVQQASNQAVEQRTAGAVDHRTQSSDGRNHGIGMMMEGSS